MMDSNEHDRPIASGAASSSSFPLDPRAERAMHRRVFCEMVRIQADARPLTWGERREYTRFAASLGIDASEARLLIRAIEHDCGHAGLDALQEGERSGPAAFLCDPESPLPWGSLAFGSGLAFLAGAIAWLIVRVR